VIVGFHDHVTEHQADSMFVAHGLRCKTQFSRLFAYWVEVESGDPAVHAARLEESPITLWAKRRGNPSGRPGGAYILVQFNTRATDESARALLDSMPGLRISSKLVTPKWGMVRVEPGTEQHWIEVLEREAIVRYASLNVIGDPDSWLRP
jgi:hypothetical protein